MGVTAIHRVVQNDLESTGQVKNPLLLRPVAWIRSAYLRVGALRFSLAVAITGVLLTLPALTVGFAQDDLFLNLVFEQHPLAQQFNMGIMDNFTFSDGDPATNALRFEMGVLPWWAVPDWQVSFWRPLASLSHWVEYKIFGLWALPMQINSLLLYGVLCFAAVMLYRRVHHGAWVAGLAGLIFAMDPVHGIPAGWISDRNALMSALFGILTLICHDRWRHDHGRAWPWAAMAVASLTVGVFCGEAIVSVGAYLFAYQLFIDPQTKLQRQPWGNNLRLLLRGILLLLPYLVVIAAWRVLYMWMDYGVHGTWMYVDPAAEPWIFLQNVFWYSPVFLAGAYAFPDGVAWNFIPDSWALIWSAYCWAFFAAMIWVMWPLLRRSPQARFWFVGSLLSVIPCAATIPGDRIVTYPALGAVALVALFLADKLENRTMLSWRSLRRPAGAVFAGIFVLCHIILAPPALMAASQSIVSMHDFFDRASDSIADDPQVEQMDYFALRTPLDMLGTSMLLFLISDDQPQPNQWRYLYSGLWELDIERPDDKTLIIRPDGGFLPKGLGQIFRDSRAHPMHAGFEKSVSGMKAEVLAVNEQGRPTEVRFTFDKSIDHTSMRFVQWEKGEYVPVAMPPAGTRMTLPATPVADVLKVALALDKHERNGN